MAKKRLVLTFPPEVVERPVVALMVREYDVITNILRAEIHEGEIGRMLVELEGEAKRLREGVKHLKDLGRAGGGGDNRYRARRGALHRPAARVRPSAFPRALKIEAPDWELELDKDRCILCGLCVDACPLQLITVKF